MSLPRRLAAFDPLSDRARPGVPVPVQRAPAEPQVASAQTFTPLDRGHRDYRQVIAHQLELRSRSLTAPTITGALVIRPGQFGAEVVRASGSLAVSLEAPPEVPQPQRTSTGKRRQRIWRTLLVIRYGAETDVSWPAGVSWGRVGYDLTTETNADGVLTAATLAPRMGPPPNPRPSGSADVVEVAYVEASGGWVASVLAEGVEGLAAPQTPDEEEPIPEDPAEDEVQDPEATDPDAAPPDGFEPGTDDSASEGPYTDGDGNPITPTTPPADTPSSRSLLAALHMDGLTISANGGASWFLSPSTPAPGVDLAWLSAQPTVLMTDGALWVSDDQIDWRQLPLSIAEIAPISITNPGFEGGLDGWKTVAGDSPSSSSSSSPPQRPGSTRYLSRDWVIFTDGEYAIEQTVTLPPIALDAIAAGSRIELSVWAYADTGATATAIMSTDGKDFFSAGGAIQGAGAGGNAGTDGDSDPVALLLVDALDGAEIGSVDVGCEHTFSSSGSLRNTMLRFWITADGVEYTHDAIVEIGTSTPVISGQFVQRALDLSLVADGEQGAYRLRIPAGWKHNVDLYASAGVVGNGFGSAQAVIETPSVELGRADLVGGGEWSQLKILSDAELEIGDAIRIRLQGSGSPADAYFDDVELGFGVVRSDTPTAMARDISGRRVIVATDAGIWSVRNGAAEQIGVLTGLTMVAADGATIVVAKGGADVLISEDNAATFFSAPVPDGESVTQIFASPSPIAMTASGRVYVISAGAMTLLATLSTGAHLAYDRRRDAWIETSMAGVTRIMRTLNSVPESFGAQPTATNADGNRRTLPTDAGRLIGYGAGDRTIYWRDTPAPWSVDHMLRRDIISIQEVL